MHEQLLFQLQLQRFHMNDVINKTHNAYYHFCKLNS